MGNSKLGLDICVGSSYINSVVSKRAVTTNRFHSDTRYRRRVISALRNSSAELVTTIWRVLLAVRKPDFHSGKTGSIPVRATYHHGSNDILHLSAGS